MPRPGSSKSAWGHKRGLAAAFFFFAMLFAMTPAARTASEPAQPQALGGTQLGDGLTLVARKATGSPTAALEVWIKCPASGYQPAHPGIARLAALTMVEQKIEGVSLREQIRKAGAQVGISVYQEGTEIAILAPGYLSSNLLDKLLSAVFHPHLDRTAFNAGRQRLAAQQVASGQLADQVLRDTVFSRIFTSGPLHEPTYGDAQTIASLSLADITNFVNQAYVPANEIVVAIGSVDPADVSRRVAAAAPPPGSSPAMPASTVASKAQGPLVISRDQLNSAGVGLGWIGPPIQDEQAATAMDFLADYLAHPTAGVIAKSLNVQDAATSLNGQFITLRNPGVFLISVTGDQLDPQIASGLIQQTIKSALASALSKSDFTLAIDAFKTHLLRDIATPQAIADNYGWYFSEGAPSYSPSATDVNLNGDYFARVSSLTPAYVFSIAKRYLSAAPVVVLLPRVPIHTAGQSIISGVHN